MLLKTPRSRNQNPDKPLRDQPLKPPSQPAIINHIESTHRQSFLNKPLKRGLTNVFDNEKTSNQKQLSISKVEKPQVQIYYQNNNNLNQQNPNQNGNASQRTPQHKSNSTENPFKNSKEYSNLVSSLKNASGKKALSILRKSVGSSIIKNDTVNIKQAFLISTPLLQKKDQSVKEIYYQCTQNYPNLKPSKLMSQSIKEHSFKLTSRREIQLELDSIVNTSLINNNSVSTRLQESYTVESDYIENIHRRSLDGSSSQRSTRSNTRYQPSKKQPVVKVEMDLESNQLHLIQPVPVKKKKKNKESISRSILKRSLSQSAKSLASKATQIKEEQTYFSPKPNKKRQVTTLWKVIELKI